MTMTTIAERVAAMTAARRSTAERTHGHFCPRAVRVGGTKRSRR